MDYIRDTMQFAKRIFLFLLTNILIVATISIVLQLLGVQPYLNRYGIDYQTLAVFCLIWGFGSALISLAISRLMAKWMMGVKVIDPKTNQAQERWLLDKVYNLSHMAGLTVMPEVGIYDSPEVNAFATGPTKSRALVAVSSGLFQRMDQQEIEGVLGHEITHITNGDMVTMTLIQGVVNAFVMFLSRILAFVLTRSGNSNDSRSSTSSYFVQMMLIIAFQILFGTLGMIVVGYFSRHREFRADAGGAKLAGRDHMIASLKKLQSLVEYTDPQQNTVTALKISSRPRGSLAMLFATHPPLEERISRLQNPA
jgi:heat shock protein HtpX